MTAEIGHFALTLALAIALVQGTLPLAGAARGRPEWMAVGSACAQAQFLFVVCAFFSLMFAYATSDFSVANVP